MDMQILQSLSPPPYCCTIVLHQCAPYPGLGWDVVPLGAFEVLPAQTLLVMEVQEDQSQVLALKLWLKHHIDLFDLK